MHSLVSVAQKEERNNDKKEKNYNWGLLTRGIL
jgi:hypothetical protein